jgi:integrase
MGSQKKSSRKADRVVRHTLADGTVKTYRYRAYKPQQRTGDMLADLLAAYERSPEWLSYSESTRRKRTTYYRLLAQVGQVPVSGVRRRDLLAVRNALAQTKGPGAATNFVAAMSVLFNWAVDNEWLETSPAYRLKSLPGGHLPAWSQADVDYALPRLPEYLRRVVVLALYTGQARHELCHATWNDYDGRYLRFVRHKTRKRTGGEEYFIPVLPALKAELDSWPRTAVTILTNQRGLPWNPEMLTIMLPRILFKIGLAGRHVLHGLRKLAAANLAEAGCTPHEIASWTNHHGLRMVELYTRSARQKELAAAVVVKMTRKEDGS